MKLIEICENWSKQTNEASKNYYKYDILVTIILCTSIIETCEEKIVALIITRGKVSREYRACVCLRFSNFFFLLKNKKNEENK